MTPTELSDRAAEAVRALNHQTRGELDNPADAYEVVANLKLMSERLPQLFTQLSAWLGEQSNEGRIAHDKGEDAQEYVDEARDCLMLADLAATQLSRALDKAQNAMSGLKQS